MRAGTVTIARRFRGPSESGNGGYVSGRLAAFVEGDAVEVTLRLPPPLDRTLDVVLEDGRALLVDGVEIVAEATSTRLDDEPAPAISFEAAATAATGYEGFDDHVFPHCFVCGPARLEGDGLRIFPGPVAGRPGVVAAPWRPDGVEPAVIWAAIDCPGAFAIGMAGRGEVLLGRMVARVHRLPRTGEPCVAIGHALGEDGRKLYAGTALYDEHSDLLAQAKQTWIVPRTA